MGDLFLRQPARQPPFPDVPRDDLPPIHGASDSPGSGFGQLR
jgi:hypothetical protein